MKALIVVHNATWFTELSQVGAAVHGHGGHEAVVYIVNYWHWSVAANAESLRRRNIPCLLETDPGPHRPKRTNGLRLLKFVKLALRGVGLTVSGDVVEEMETLRAATTAARALVRSTRPDVAILGGDMPEYTTAAFIRAFHREGVPTVLVPSTMSNGLEQAEVYSTDPRHAVVTPYARLVARLFPKWVRFHRGTRVLRCRPGRILAAEMLRIAPPAPWAFNSGSADAIAMESDAMVDYYSAAGLSTDNVVVTGSPSDDVMTRALASSVRLREELYAELGLQSGRSMLLATLIPDFLDVRGGRPECDFQSYDELLSFYLGALTAQETFNVVLALHPSIRIETMRHLEGPRLRIASRRTAELVPLCDLYVASASSTIRWAIACGKPVVNYDVYRFRYTDFVGVPGVVETSEREEFRTLIRDLTSDGERLGWLRQKQESVAARWGRLDGHSTERVVELVERISRPTIPNVTTGKAA